MKAVYDWADAAWTDGSFTALGAVVYSTMWPKSSNTKNPYPMFGLRVMPGLLWIDLAEQEVRTPTGDA